MNPMLATRAASGTDLPRGPEWMYEVKWDGVRVLADTTGGHLRLIARSGRDVTVTYPELVGLGAVQGALLDGEVVVMSAGVPSFEALAERRATLEQLALPDRVQLSPVYPDLDDLWAVTLEHGLEGVMAKRRSSTYQPGRRSPDWVKAAHRGTRVAAVVGWRPEAGAEAVPGVATSRIGAVLLGARDAVGHWRYLGKAGSGLGGSRGVDLARELLPVHRDTSPLDEPVPAADARGVRWCEPRVGVDVAYLQRMRSGRLRQPVIRALRSDAAIDPWEAP